MEINPEHALPHEARLLQLNCDKSIQGLEWTPHWDFDRTVAMTVQWYREITDGDSARKVTGYQIEQYMEP